MASKPRIFISRMIPDRALNLLDSDAFDIHIWEEDTPPPRAKLLDELALADGVITMLTETIDKEAFDAAPKLKVISNYAVGYDNIDTASATARGIPVGNTPGVLTETTADQAFALLLASARRLVEGVDYVRDGKWQTWNPIQLLGRDIHGATLGIIGLGRIGYAMAKRAQGFGMQILYYGGSNPQYAEKVGAQQVEFEALLQESDFISLHTPLTDETHHLINTDALQQMKNTATLINTARGGVVDSEALVDALQSGTIASAALDVTDPEPIDLSHPLVKLPNCIVVPHLGSATWQTRERMGVLAVENLLAGLNGDILPHCVNTQIYKRY